MAATSRFDWTSAGGQRWLSDVAQEQEEDLLEHLLTACVLLLLHETSASCAQLHDALTALRLQEDPAVLQATLEAMEDTGLIFSTWGPFATAPRRHTFHIAAAGRQWLRHAAGELQSAEGFLGAFVARCGERFV
jgi:DNA-binding PadR family transcriptional regulator